MTVDDPAENEVKDVFWGQYLKWKRKKLWNYDKNLGEKKQRRE